MFLKKITPKTKSVITFRFLVNPQSQLKRKKNTRPLPTINYKNKVISFQLTILNYLK